MKFLTASECYERTGQESHQHIRGIGVRKYIPIGQKAINEWAYKEQCECLIRT